MKKLSLTYLIAAALACGSLFLWAAEMEDTTIDSKLTFEEAVKGSPAPDSIIKSLTLLDVEYYSFDGKLHRGQLVVSKDVAKDAREVFELIKTEKFPVAKVIPIVKFGWDDEKSMSANNTSSFCYRKVAGKKTLSRHALGRAIDINPFLNPVIYPGGRVSPKGAKRIPGNPGVFTPDSPIVKEFLKRGWRWGGMWKDPVDNHHFDK
ncbi:MAG: M15 family metallopeptidase [Chloroflexota bacterium]